MSKKSKFVGVLKFLNNTQENTIRSYLQTIKRYEKFHNASIESLVLEALDEQEERVPLHRLKIIERIEDFQNHLINEGLVYGTIQTYMVNIKSIYHKNRIKIPYIEPINPNQCKMRDVIEYKDILTKDELRQILPLMSLPIKTRAMVMIQGGLSNEECEHLTTRSFIDELKCYHQKDDDIQALQWLANENNPVIWITKLVRVKTGKIYYAIIGAEAVNMIAECKLYEKNLPKNKGKIPDKLLATHKVSMNNVCLKLNKRLRLGQAGGENRLKPHSLRKFHSTYIRGGVLTYDENVKLSSSEIDEMQGRGKTKTQETYIKSNPAIQKLIYAKVMNNISLWHEYDYRIIDDDVQVFLKDPISEKKKLEEQIKNLSSQLQKKKYTSEKVEKLREELGDDGLKELIGEILSVS